MDCQLSKFRLKVHEHFLPIQHQVINVLIYIHHANLIHCDCNYLPRKILNFQSSVHGHNVNYTGIVLHKALAS